MSRIGGRVRYIRRRSGSLRIVFIGDTLLGGDAAPTLAQSGYDYAFEGLGTLFRGADLVMANHEGPITRTTERLSTLVGKRKWWYRADLDTA